MGDNEFRSLRRPVVESHADPGSEMSDPLAELARLIGQSRSQGVFGRAGEAASAEAPADPALDWAGEEHVEPGREPQPDRTPASQYSPPLLDDAHDDTHDTGHDEPYRDDAEAHAAFGDEPPPADDEAAEDDHSEAGYDELYEPYEEERSPRRKRTSSVVLGIVGLIALGSAGAFGYRALFGGSAFPALPPIIKPSGTPVKIVPDHDSQAAHQTRQAKAGDHLVSHEEKPVAVEAAHPPANANPAASANPAPGGVTTLPVISNTPGDGVWPATQPPAAGKETGTSKPSVADAAGAPAPDSPPPKPVHTLAIHTGRPAAGAGERRVGSGAGPLSIIPGGKPEAPSRSRQAVALQSPPPPGPAGSATGGYAVQVSALRSEADAQATLNALVAKYPQQLGNQHAMVRRADLGAKGIYYRALVGPFGSAQEASRLCSSLKAAGGTCIIQKI